MKTWKEFIPPYWIWSNFFPIHIFIINRSIEKILELSSEKLQNDISSIIIISFRIGKAISMTFYRWHCVLNHLGVIKLFISLQNDDLTRGDTAKYFPLWKRQFCYFQTTLFYLSMFTERALVPHKIFSDNWSWKLVISQDR